MDIFLKITFEYFMVLFLGIQYFHGIVNYRLETSKFFISLQHNHVWAISGRGPYGKLSAFTLVTISWGRCIAIYANT